RTTSLSKARDMGSAGRNGGARHSTKRSTSFFLATHRANSCGSTPCATPRSGIRHPSYTLAVRGIRKSTARSLLWGIVPALVLSVGCSGKGGAAAAGQQAARQVKVENAEVRDVRRAVDVVGTLSAREDVVVSAEVAGRVAALRHDLGDRVESGDVLVELDREKAQYGVEAQRAALAQARAKYGASETGDLPPLEHVPEVVSAKSQHADAKQR